MIVMNQDENTRVDSTEEEPEYDSYDDDWPSTSWDEDDSRRAKHLH
jgi:hypothetical protein